MRQCVITLVTCITATHAGPTESSTSTSDQHLRGPRVTLMQPACALCYCRARCPWDRQTDGQTDTLPFFYTYRTRGPRNKHISWSFCFYSIYLFIYLNIGGKRRKPLIFLSCSYRVRGVGGSCAEHLTVESYTIIISLQSYLLLLVFHHPLTLTL